MTTDDPDTDEPSQRVQEGDVVAYRYLIRAEGGQVLAASSEIVRYIQGGEETFPKALASELLGRRDGESFTVRLNPDDAFGSRGEPRLLTLPRDRFSDLLTLEPGSRVDTHTEEGDEVSVWVVEASEQEVVVDFDHPLAGRLLQFEVAVLSIRVATAAERRTGRATSASDEAPKTGAGAADLAGQLAELRRALVARFHAEEGTGGLHESIESHGYGQEKRVQGMQDTHAELLDSLDDLAARVDDPKTGVDHKKALIALLQEIAKHESSESALLQDSIHTDFGGEG